MYSETGVIMSEDKETSKRHGSIKQTEVAADARINPDAKTSKCCCSERHKDRSEAEKKALLTRLRKIEGQIRGLEKMVENDIYCPDILTQSSAAGSALNSFNKVLLSYHIRSCVAEDIRDGNEEKIDELCQLLQKLMK